jgi:hypothetical protein
MRKTFGTVSADRTGAAITVNGPNATQAWAYANFAIANSKLYGVTRLIVGDQEWRLNAVDVAAWTKAGAPQPAGTVLMTVRS